MTIINMSGGKPAKPIVVEAVEDTPSTLPHTYVPREGVDYLSSVTVGKDPNLVPENVKKDVSIFGTVGTLESGGGTTMLPDNSDLLAPGKTTPIAYISGFTPVLTPLDENTRPAKVYGGNYWNGMMGMVIDEGIIMTYNSDHVQEGNWLMNYSFDIPVSIEVDSFNNNQATGWCSWDYAHDGTYSAKLAFGYNMMLSASGSAWYNDAGWLDGTVTKSGNHVTFGFPEGHKGYVGTTSTPTYMLVYCLIARRIS